MPGSLGGSASWKTDLRRKTCLIIQKQGRYYAGNNRIIGGLSWSSNRYDAWRTRNRIAACRIAKLVGGTLLLFNPVVGQTQLYHDTRPKKMGGGIMIRGCLEDALAMIYWVILIGGIIAVAWTSVELIQENRMWKQIEKLHGEETAWNERL